MKIPVARGQPLTRALGIRYSKAMMRLATIALIAALCAVAGAVDSGENSIYGMQNLSINADSQWKHELVLSHEGQPGFDFLRAPRSPGSAIELLVTADKAQAFKELLKANGIEYEILSDDVSKQIRVELQQQMRAKLRRRSGGDSSLDLRAFPRYDERFALGFPNYYCPWKQFWQMQYRHYRRRIHCGGSILKRKYFAYITSSFLFLGGYVNANFIKCTT